jgi:uncharacterized protein (DUF58 family)
MEEVKELIRKVRNIEIKARGLTKQLFSGQYHAAFKGRGISFAEVREYQYGDDVRLIDWNVTARQNKPFIKVFDEERELSVMLLIDVSASSTFGAHHASRRELIAEMFAVLAFSALQNNDKVGMILFSDHVESFVPPRKGKAHILRMVRDVLQHTPTGKKTDVALALDYLGKVIKRRCTAFLLSDLGKGELGKSLKIVGRMHDLLVLQVVDALERSLPNVGLVYVQDPETGETRLMDTANAKVRKAYMTQWLERQEMIRKQMRSTGTDHVQIFTDTGYIQPIRQLFHQREWRR